MATKMEMTGIFPSLRSPPPTPLTTTPAAAPGPRRRSTFPVLLEKRDQVGRRNQQPPAGRTWRTSPRFQRMLAMKMKMKMKMTGLRLKKEKLPWEEKLCVASFALKHYQAMPN